MASKKQQEAIRKGFRISVILIPIAVVVGLLILLFLGIQINFILNDELNLVLEPRDSSYFTRKEVVDINFTITNNNFFLCRSWCEYSLADLRDNSVISSEKFEMRHGEAKLKQFKLSPPQRGAGQAIYNFQVSCKNIKTILCRTDEQPRYKTSIVSINYDLSEEEATLKGLLKSEIEKWALQVENASVLLRENEMLIERLPDSSAKDEFSKRKRLLEEEINKLLEEKNEIISLWNAEDYFALTNEFSEEQIKETDAIKTRLLELRFDVFFEIQSINSNILHIKDVEVYKPVAEEASEFYQKEMNERNFARLSALNDVAEDIYQSYLLLKDNKVKNHTGFVDTILWQKELLKNLTLEYTEIKTEGLLLQNYSKTQLELRNITVNTSFKFSCDVLRKGAFEIETENNKSAETNRTLINNSMNLEFLGENCGDRSVRKVNLRGIEKLFSVNISSLEGSLIDNQPLDLEVSFVPLNPNPPRCCIFGECKPCCTEECGNKEEMFPVLFIHGHTFNEANTPEFSMSSFTKIQRKMQEDGFINAGEIDVTLDPKQFQYGELGRSGRPVTVRASYYYIRLYDLGVYTVKAQKSERIENYAIRLKEIIDLLKHRTGANKVNIVAHSMGGLVVREYIVLFGSNDVNKVILVNTPNKGISKNTARKCKLFGSTKECEDMTEGSVFLKRLNARQLENVEIHNIGSTGCEMEEGKQGDGVVAIENTYLEGAKNYQIEGKCTDAFNSNLHTNVLDIDIYPETYKIIKKILEK